MEQQAARHLALLTALTTREARRAADRLVHQRERVRSRATLRRLGGHLAYRWESIDRPPLEMAISLVPSESLHATPPPDAAGDDCCFVSATLCGGLGELEDWPGTQPSITTQLWGMNVARHAICNIFDRGENPDPAGEILAAHGRLLTGDLDFAVANFDEFYLAGCDGVFPARLFQASKQGRLTGLLTVLPTFLAWDQLEPEQLAQIRQKILPQAVSDERRLSSYMMPISLYRLKERPKHGTSLAPRPDRVKARKRLR